MAGVTIVKLGDRTQSANILATWEKACENGPYAGCHAAGAMLALDPQGLGIPLDMSRGRAYLAKACAMRYLPSCSVIAGIVVELKETSSWGTRPRQTSEARADEGNLRSAHLRGLQHQLGLEGPSASWGKLHFDRDVLAVGNIDRELREYLE